MGGSFSDYRRNASFFVSETREPERSVGVVINIQDDILRLHAMGLLERLLQDKATRGNILWATDAYAEHGDWYSPGNEIRSQRITGEYSDLIKTRARRAMEQRTARTRQHAEVFTPLWIVKKMNDVADEQWFGRKTGIYKQTEDGKIYFSKSKHWKLFADARRLEITCGEAPFLVTRYDVETGEALPVEDRIGLLDRKLRAVSENAQDLDEWKTWALRAVQATYGYELQGDNLLIARVNVLCSVEEHMIHRWKEKPDKAFLEKLCTVICWNLWQMDGINGCVPVPPQPTEEQISLFPPLMEQTNLFGEMEKKEIPCRLYDWRFKRSICYSELREKGSELMKFDFIIGNPPYQDETVGEQKQFAPPIYDKFMDAAYTIADKVELIHPARFLFNAGGTRKEWNKKMLNDVHFKVLYHEQDSAKIFANTDIKGGVAISYHDWKKDFGAIGVYTAFPELNSILNKVRSYSGFESFSTIIANRGLYRFSKKCYDEQPEEMKKISDSRVGASAFERLSSLFFENKPEDGNIYVPFFGLLNAKRVYRWFRKDYFNMVNSFDKYKVMVPAANGSGALGEVLSTPVIGQPVIGHTETFMSIGSFDSEQEATSCYKYLCSKFCRAMLGVLKITQHNSPEKWFYIPLQDFTPDSDIDWSKSIPEIDQQLYAKYGLDGAEIEFIETHVKAMA